MGSPDASGWLPSGVAIVIGVVGAIISYVRSVTRADEQIKAINKTLEDMKTLRTQEHASIKDSIDTWGRQVGESIAAVRQKIEITDMDLKRAELWNRDNFVRGTEFIQLRTSIEQALDRIDDKLDRMREGIEERIDSIRSPP